MAIADLPDLPEGNAPAPALPTISPGLASLPDLPEGDAPLPSHPTAGPSGDIWTDIGRRAATAGTDALAGFVSLPRLASGAIDWLGSKAGVNVGADLALASIRDPSNPASPLFPTPQQAKAMAYQTTGATEYVPQTEAGRIGQAALTGGVTALAGGVPSLLGSGFRAAAGAAPEIIAGLKGAASQIPALAGGSATSEAAGETAQNLGLPPEVATAARLAGFIPGSIGADLITSGATRLGGAAIGAGTSTPLADAYSRLGVDSSLVANITGSPTQRAFQGFAARAPGSSDAIAAASGKAVTDWQNALDKTSGMMGTAQTPYELGDSLISGAQNWLDNYKSNRDASWGAFRQLVPSDTHISIGNFDGELDSILGDYQGASSLRNVFQDGLAGRSVEALQNDASETGTLPWGTVQTIRSAIGDKLGNPQVVSDTSQATLKRLYGALSDDMRTGAQAQGGSAATLYDLANAYTAAGHGLIEGSLSGLLKPGVTPESAATFALGQARLGPSRVSDIAGAIPGAGGQMGSYALQNAATGINSPTSLATNLAGRKPIYSPDVQSLLFNDPAVAQNVQDLVTVGKSLQDAQNYVNNPMSGHTANMGLGRVLSAIELAKMGRDVAGFPGAAVGGAAGFMSPEMIAKGAGAIAMPGPTMRALMMAPGFTPPAPGFLNRWATRGALASQPQSQPPAASLLNNQ